MATSDERRDVAAKLRALAHDNQGLLGAVRMRRVMDEGTRILGTVGLPDCAHVLTRCADLIDIPTCRNVSGYQDVFECSECRCKVELISEVCNEHGEPFSTPFMPSFCPRCGAKVER